MEYGLASYKNCTLEPEDAGLCTYIENGYITGYPGSKSVKIPVGPKGSLPISFCATMKSRTVRSRLSEAWMPRSKKAKHLDIEYSIDGFPAARFRLAAGCSARKRTFMICLDWITDRFLFQ